MDIRECIQRYSTIFSKSFYATALKKYGVDFNSSVISNVQAKLYQLQINVRDGIIKQEHNGLQITDTDIEIIIESLESLIRYYKTYHKISGIPSNLKDKDLVADVTNKILFQKADDSAVKTEELFNKFIVPPNHNLTAKQISQIEADALIANTNQSTRKNKKY
ncbi:hypothetical protein [Pedobacter frigiditerrae]|uniref:hypothetical protein n=1 Tax=Pedobacter frigiditerrae TaxID=2530452 RepID=UPI00292CC6C2|nr:hypothetical protein [Pedobacter frigiditerrae]